MNLSIIIRADNEDGIKFIMQEALKRWQLILIIVWISLVIIIGLIERYRLPEHRSEKQDIMLKLSKPEVKERVIEIDLLL